MSNKPPTGMVLVMVLVVVVMVSLAGFNFVDWMVLEQKAVSLGGDELQVRYVAESGQQFVTSFLARSRAGRARAGGLIDNPGLFRGVLVLDRLPGGRRARFSLLTPWRGQEEVEARELPVRFGLENESARLNLAVLPRWEQDRPGSATRALMNLPGMTVQIADALLDWLDEDGQTRPFGAEAEFYGNLEPPYTPRNGLPERIEELLLVRGVTRELLFGSERSTWIVGGDPDDERSGADRRGSVDPLDGPVRLWSSLLTLHSAERNTTRDGRPRIDLNGSDLAVLRQRLLENLDPEWVAFIVAYRQFGPAAADSTTTAPGPVPFDATRPAQFTIGSVLDLIGALVELPAEGEDEPRVLASPFTPDQPAMQKYLPRLTDEVSVGAWTRRAGRINVNEADPRVLRSVPGIDDATVDRIVSARRQAARVEDDRGRDHATWLVAEDVVSLSRMVDFLPYLTAGGDVFRGQVIAFFEQGGPIARREIVIDATSDPPRLVSRTDLRLLGLGTPLEQIGARPTGSMNDRAESADDRTGRGQDAATLNEWAQ